MKTYAYVAVALVLSTVAAHGVSAAPSQTPKQGSPSAPRNAVVTHGGPAARGQITTNGRLPGALGKLGGEAPGGGKGSSSINGTGMGAHH